jgi:hypothetical protein
MSTERDLQSRISQAIDQLLEITTSASVGPYDVPLGTKPVSAARWGRRKRRKHRKPQRRLSTEQIEPDDIDWGPDDEVIHKWIEDAREILESNGFELREGYPKSAKMIIHPEGESFLCVHVALAKPEELDNATELLIREGGFYVWSSYPEGSMMISKEELGIDAD